MSGKLDQSLDEIMSGQPRTRGSGRRGGRPRRVTKTGTTATVAPVGGIKKNTRNTTAPKKSIPTGPVGGIGSSKIVVSNLPKDVNEAQIKEYFVKSVGPIKKVEISYGPNGSSRGIANVIFARADGATTALSKLNGLLVDGKPMKIEMVLDATRATALPGPKGLGDRIAQPKSQPKSAASTKAAPSTVKATDAKRGRGKKARGGRSARPSKKTAEELDSEMVDYFGGGAPAENGAAATNATAQPAAPGDAMEDEIL